MERNQQDEETIRIWQKIQLELKSQLIDYDSFHSGDCENAIHLIGGVDISFVPKSNKDAFAALVVMRYPSMDIVYEKCIHVVLKEPYIPGFLAFREVESLVSLLHDLKATRQDLYPHVIMVDGNGILHPLGFGLACHLGVLTDTPTIGIAKTFFKVDGVTKDKIKEKLQCMKRSNCDTLTVPIQGDSGKIWGVAHCSSSSITNPIFVSQGHRISLKTALEFAQKCSVYRVPEPIRRADQFSREEIRKRNKNNILSSQLVI